MAKNSTAVKNGGVKAEKRPVRQMKAEATVPQRKRAFGPRSLRSHYSNRASGLTVRAWVGKSDFLIRDDRGIEVDVPESEVDALIQSLIDLKRKKAQREMGQ